MQGRADFGNAAFSTTLARAQVISYGTPYYRDAFTFIVRKSSDGGLNLLAFVEIFSTRAWVFIVLAVVAGATAVGMARR